LKSAIYINNVDKSILFHTENTARFPYKEQLVKILWGNKQVLK